MPRTTTPDRIRLVVLFGGISAEHDVSCTSAAHLLRAADRTAYDLVPVGITRDGSWVRQDAALSALAGGGQLPDRLETVGTPVNPVDVLTDPASGLQTVVLPLLHGPHGEDGTIQGLLELAAVPYVGTGVLGSAVSMDKAMAKIVARDAGIPQGAWIEYRGGGESVEQLAERAASELDFPVFVKPANMGSSVGISKVTSAAGLPEAIEKALRYDEVLVLESGVNGREIEVGVLGGLEPTASVPGEIIPGADFYDYEDKYVTGGAKLQVPADLPDDEIARVQDLARQVFRAYRISGLARIDFFYDAGDPNRRGAGWLLNEANTMPGFTPYSMYPKLWEATGVSYSDLIDRLVHIALSRHARRVAISTYR